MSTSPNRPTNAYPAEEEHQNDTAKEERKGKTDPNVLVPADSGNYTCHFCEQPFLGLFQLEIHMKDQYDSMLQSMRTGQTDHILDQMLHVGCLENLEDAFQVVETALESEQNFMDVLVEHRVIPADSMFFNNMTLLHLAAQKGHAEAIQCLVNHPLINVSARDGNGNTAMHFAAMGGHHECVETLLDAKCVADTVNWKNYQGKDPLTLCFESEASDFDKGAVLSVLLEKSSMEGIEISDKYNDIIVEGIAEELMLCYWKNVENEADIIKRILGFLNAQSPDLLYEICEEYVERARESSFSHLTAEGTMEDLGDDRILIHIENTGTFPFVCEMVFPDMAREIFTVVESSTEPIKQKESSTIIIQRSAPKNNYKAFCFLAKCSNSLPSDVGSFYCIIPYLPK